MKNKINISIIGMGYVGLPLACKFGSHYPTIGFDINNIRINQLKKHEDKTKEVSNSEIKNSKKLSFTSDEYLLKDSNIYIITVPTPINSKKKPDFRPLKSASKMFYGQDAQRGSPPPLLYLTGLGEYQFNEQPCVVSEFNLNLPSDVNYIRARSRHINRDDQLQFEKPLATATQRPLFADCLFP